MKQVVLICSLIFCADVFAQTQSDYTIHQLKSVQFTEDKTYVYALPFEQNKKIFLIQAYDSKMSHKGEYALDF
ncbi:MAG: hypothetical protein K2X48_12570 [Chitinophagaceae bacterium]|nr:hypothetical protein [Chitinophagaceae bacterium]